MRTQGSTVRPLARAVVVALVMALDMLILVAVGHAEAVPDARAVAAVAPDQDDSPEDSGMAPGTPCTRYADACVDLAAKKAWLIDGDGEVMYGPVPIAIGGPGKAATPRGTFYVQWKHRDHRSKEFDNAPMPFAVFFADGGIAFHGGNLNSNSRGCVRLAMKDAEAFFDFLEVDDEVQVR